jgi:hypothetical protein
VIVGIPDDYAVPEGTLPLLAGILSMMDFAHRNMCAIVADLPPEALTWKPGPQMGALAGIIAHTMYCETYGYRRAAGETVEWDDHINEELWSSGDDAVQAVARIAAGDTTMKEILPTMTVERMNAQFRTSDQTAIQSGGHLIAEAVTHTTMHWGHMQMTRQLWELAHPAFHGTYEPWQ